MARPKEFDRDEALGRAMKVFWERGYDNTSITDLVEGTGVGRQSLYDTFGDKLAIYLAVLDLYRREQGKELFAHNSSPRKALEATFRKMARTVGEAERPSCMMVDAALSVAAGADRPIAKLVKENFAANERLFLDLLHAAEDAGEIQKGQDKRAIARTLINAVHGLRLTARTAHDPSFVEDVIRQTLSSIR
jgi:TetR/AcrR family transcriptional repressor of nem operon